MCWLRIGGNFLNCGIINTHAQTEDKSDTVKDAFYDGLRNLYGACPKHDVKLIIGDLNAQIGKEAIYYPTIGKEAYHQESNENGKRIIHLAASRNMVIGTTLFPHKDIYKIAWRSPDVHRFSQIDHLLIDSRLVSHLMDARTHRCANVDSEHFLLVSRIRARISNAKKSLGKKVENYDYEKMNLSEKQVEYKGVSKSSRTVLVKRSLLTLDVKFLHHLQSTPLLHEYSGPSVSAMLGRIPGSPFLELCQVPAAIPLESLQWCRMFDPSSEASAWGRGKSRRGPDRVSMGDGGSLSCCSWPKTAKL